MNTSLQRRVMIVAFFTVFLDMIAFGLILPLLPLYVKSLGGSAEAVGFLFSSFALTQLFSTPLLGRWSDARGRRPVILFSLAGSACAMALFAAADTLPLLFLSRILGGAMAGNIPTCQAAIADITPRMHRARRLGTLGAALGLGLALGPFLGGITSALGTAAPPLLATAMIVLDWIMALILFPETRGFQKASAAKKQDEVDPVDTVSDAEGFDARDARLGGKTKTDSKRHERMSPLQLLRTTPALASILSVQLLAFLILGNVQVALVLMIHDRLGWGETEAGYLFGLFGLSSLIIQGGLIGRLVDRFGEIRLVITGGLVMSVGMIFLALGRSATPVLIGAMGFALAFAITTPSITAIVSRLGSDDAQGATLGISQSAGGLARAIGPSLAGALYARLGSAAPFLNGAILALLWTLAALETKKRMRRDKTARSSTTRRAMKSARHRPKTSSREG